MKSIVVSMLLLSTSLSPVLAAGFEVLAPHRAVYDVELVEAQDRSGIQDMNGRIVYEINGSACEGISVQYRFVTKIDTARDSFVTDQQSASFESPDGQEFSFFTKSFVNEQPDQSVRGTAKQTENGIEVVHEGEPPKKFQLAKGLFTSSHLIEIMKSAEAGEAFVSHVVFDGSADADVVLDSATVMGREKTVPETLKGEGDVTSLLEKPAWPVTMSYFDRNPDNSAEAVPIYEASFLLYKNGVTRDLTMRYPDYELKATLSELQLLEQTACE